LGTPFAPTTTTYILEHLHVHLSLQCTSITNLVCSPMTHHVVHAPYEEACRRRKSTGETGVQKPREREREREREIERKDDHYHGTRSR
jgi:hypothetical protein